MQRRLQALYHRVAGPAGAVREPEFPNRGSAWIWRGMRLATDTYFNTFFEPHWRQYTRLDGLRLRLALSGAGTVRLLRRGALSGSAVLAAENFSGEDTEV